MHCDKPEKETKESTAVFQKIKVGEIGHSNSSSFNIQQRSNL